VDQGTGLGRQVREQPGQVDVAEEGVGHGEGHLVGGVLRLRVRPYGALSEVTAVGAEAAMGAWNRRFCWSLVDGGCSRDGST
jgi:hypothetical protein